MDRLGHEVAAIKVAVVEGHNNDYAVYVSPASVSDEDARLHGVKVPIRDEHGPNFARALFHIGAIDHPWHVTHSYRP